MLLLLIGLLKAQILTLLRMCGRLYKHVLKPEIQKQQGNYGMPFSKNGIRSLGKISMQPNMSECDWS